MPVDILALADRNRSQYRNSRHWPWLAARSRRHPNRPEVAVRVFDVLIELVVVAGAHLLGGEEAEEVDELEGRRRGPAGSAMSSRSAGPSAGEVDVYGHAGVRFELRHKVGGRPGWSFYVACHQQVELGAGRIFSS